MSLVRVASVRDPHEAHLLRTLLESAGIPAYVAGEHLVGVNWLYSQAIGGVGVQVSEADAEAARLVLAARWQETPEEPDEEDTCPRCGSTSIGPDRTDTRVRSVSLGAGFPIGTGRYRWRCSSCSHTWRSVPSHRGPGHVLLDLLALVLLILGGALLLPVRLVRRLREPDTRPGFLCWSCGGEYAADARRCPHCGIRLPDVVAYRELVEPGRAYDGACPVCHTPYAREDYRANAPRKLCSRCRSELLW